MRTGIGGGGKVSTALRWKSKFLWMVVGNSKFSLELQFAKTLLAQCGRRPIPEACRH